ncbi:MAG TPA: hypothetical protein VF021_07175, partial [Longimicrobiales bacterium]
MRSRFLLAACVLALGTTRASAQSFATDDPVLRRIWSLGMDSSQAYPLAQVLMDSIGPRLTSSPEHLAGNNWLVSQYQRWGISARNEQYGTWPSWQRGYTHVDLVAPRVRTLDATLLAWSGGTKGPVTAPVVLLPALADSGALAAWAPSAKGKFVAISFAEPTCRPDRQWQEFAAADVFQNMRTQRDTARRVFQRRSAALG